MELLGKGINLVFLDNQTVSSDYIMNLMEVAQNQQRIAKKALENTVELLIMVELDRVEKERETIAKRISDGIKASNKKNGRKAGQLDKMTEELREDLKKFMTDRSIKQVDLMKKHNISRNTLKKYIEVIKEEVQ